MEIVRSFFKSQRELIMYGVIGCSGVALDCLAFFLLTHYLSVHYLLSNAISITIGICNNFYWNATLNFKVKDKLLMRFFSFYCVGLIGMGVSSILLYLFVDVGGVNLIAAKLAIICIVTVSQFLLNKFLTFKKGGEL